MIEEKNDGMDLEATLEKVRSRAQWPNPRLLYWSEGGDPSIPVDPGRDRLLAAFKAGMDAAREDEDLDGFWLAVVGSVKRPPDDYFVLAPFHDPGASPEHPDAPDEWAMCGWCRHQVLRRDFDPDRAVWIMGIEPLATYDTGAEAMAFIRGVSNERRRGTETMEAALSRTPEKRT